MTISKLGNDFLTQAEEHRKSGASAQAVAEALCEAMVAIVPEDLPLRNVILEGCYAHLAKILGRDASKMLD